MDARRITNYHAGVLYVTTLQSNDSKQLLESAISNFLASTEEGGVELLYSLYYEQEQTAKATSDSLEASEASLDLAFNDEILDDVEKQWKSILGETEADQATFMRFEDREGMNNEDDEDIETF